MLPWNNDPTLKHIADDNSVAVGAAAFSLGRKLYTDKQLRLSRSGGIAHRNTEPKPGQH